MTNRLANVCMCTAALALACAQDVEEVPQHVPQEAPTPVLAETTPTRPTPEPERIVANRWAYTTKQDAFGGGRAWTTSTAWPSGVTSLFALTCTWDEGGSDPTFDARLESADIAALEDYDRRGSTSLRLHVDGVELPPGPAHGGRWGEGNAWTFDGRGKPNYVTGNVPLVAASALIAGDTLHVEHVDGQGALLAAATFALQGSSAALGANGLAGCDWAKAERLRTREREARAEAQRIERERAAARNDPCRNGARFVKYGLGLGWWLENPSKTFEQSVRSRYQYPERVERLVEQIGAGGPVEYWEFAALTGNPCPNQR